ncbi:hypothetical protein UF72_0811 [Staphylococcus equorum subsp. equorum]|nr:hypothetical protein UF72_0811 [Staphylococcus equorum subsp. equorum]
MLELTSRDDQIDKFNEVIIMSNYYDAFKDAVSTWWGQ